MCRISLPNMHPVHRSLVLDNAEQLWGMDPETASELMAGRWKQAYHCALVCSNLLPNLDLGHRSLVLDDSK